MNLCHTNMTKTKNKTKTNLDGTLKRVHTEVSNSSLSDEESTSSFQKGSNKSKMIASNWPRFLVISSSDEEALKTLSPFCYTPTYTEGMGWFGWFKKTKNGSLFVECSTEKHSKWLLKSTSPANVSTEVSPHFLP